MTAALHCAATPKSSIMFPGILSTLKLLQAIEISVTPSQIFSPYKCSYSLWAKKKISNFTDKFSVSLFRPASFIKNQETE